MIPSSRDQNGERSYWSRRQVLQAGSLGALGLHLPHFLAPAAAADSATTRPAGFGRAKSCILIFAWGGPSQLDTLDMKPNAPTEIRGTFSPISTRTPGLQVCEYFGRLAQWTQRLAVIRSLTHNDPAHLSSAHATVTGSWAPVVRSDRTPPSQRDTPHIGAFVSRLRPASSQLPSSVIMPWKAFHPAAPGGEAPGQHGGWLGSTHDPLLVSGDPAQADWSPPALGLGAGLSPERMLDRYAMLQQLDRQRQDLENASISRQWAGRRRQAVDLLCGPEVARAFDLSREPEAVRQRYGMNTHGQCVLLARRLVEHGVPLVTVNWHNDAGNFWDTHANNFTRLKNDLIPPTDLALTALFEDLDARGMWDETLVAWVGEFGRRPTISAAHAGREHWPHCYSGILAGAGIPGGAIHGSSDRHAAYPETDPVSPLDYAATMFHLLGIDGQRMLEDREGRPHRVCSGRPIEALLT